MKNAYIYYRIVPEQAGLAAVRIDALLDTMTRYCRQPPQRLRRCDDPHMWMEIYPGISDFAAFSTAVRAFNCAEFTQGERHLECFYPPDTAPESQA